MLMLIDPDKTKAGAQSSLLLAELNSLKTIITAQDANVLIKQTEKLREVKKYVQDMKIRTQADIQEANSILQKLEMEASDLERKVNADQKIHSDGAKQSALRTQISKAQSEYITSCKQRVEIAKTVNVKVLNKIELQDKKSAANEVFRWVMIALYMTPDSKYFWPNFQEEVFDKDEGKDFIERLGKYSALLAKEEQKSKTDWIIHHAEEILASPEVAEAKEHIKSIIEVAKIYAKCILISRQIKAYEKQIEEDKVGVGKLREQTIRLKARANAIRDRHSVMDIYRKQLLVLHETVSAKPILYGQKIEEAEGLKNQFKTNSSTPNALYTPNTNVTEQREQCTCQIY